MIFGLDRYFAYPSVLIAVLSVPVVLFWFAFLVARRRKALLKITPDVASSFTQRLQMYLTGVGFALILCAAARPEFFGCQGGDLENFRKVCKKAAAR